jgi:hypothetical protein
MAQRKSISKKTRFDVFKRDLFCCQYCGKRPPQTTLEVDHIDPVANGGDNSINNLVTSCFDCNRGKSDRLLTAVPESLSNKAKRIKECEEQLSEYRKIINAQNERIESDCWSVIHALFGEDTNSIRTDWFSSVKKFVSNIDLIEAIEAAEIASSKKRFSSDKTIFHYFCGICWNKIKGASNG